MKRCTKMQCLCCLNTAVVEHHIIFKSQGGSNHPDNLASLCSECHYAIHHGMDILKRDWIMIKCYSTIKDWSKVWTGKIKPKQVRENEK